MRFLHDDLARRVSPTTGAGFEIGSGLSNLFDGNRHTFARRNSTTSWAVTYDSGAGNTLVSDSLVLARADLIHGLGTVVVQHSDDASAWTNAFAPVTLDASDLDALHGEDWVALFTSETKRAWRVLFGAFSSNLVLAGLMLGKSLVLGRDPRYGGASLGISRAHAGASLRLSFRTEEPTAVQMETYLRDVTPSWPGEQPARTSAGAVFGSRPHWIYDETGNVFRRNGMATSMNVLVSSPNVSIDAASLPAYEWDIDYLEVR